MIKFLIQRPIAVVMTFIAAVILGIVAYKNLPISLLPDIPIPEVNVHISYPNSSANEIESVIIKPLRAQLLQVYHLNMIKCETHDGQAEIKLKFDFGTNIDFAFIDVNEKIDGAMVSLPRDLQRPRVIKSSATDIPVFYLSLSLMSNCKENDSIAYDDRFIDLSDFSESVVRKRLEQLPEVAIVDLTGTTSSQVIIEPDKQKMTNLNISNAIIEDALKKNNIDAGNISIRNGHHQYTVHITSLLRSKEDIENISFTIQGKIIQLKEFATIRISQMEYSGMFLNNGNAAINMAIIKQSDARLGKLKSELKEIIAQFEKEYPDIHFEISQDQTQLLDYSIQNLKQNLIQGLLFVILVVFVFMKDLKLPLLIGISLLVSVIISILFFFVMDISINVISLAGLILAIGNMMDNSIVITENINQYREQNYSVEAACITGTNEVIIPQLSSMLVNISVFLPLVFLSGIAGSLMYDEAISVTIGLSVSYIVGIILMPVVYNLAYSKVYKLENRIQKIKENTLGNINLKLKRLIDLDKAYTSMLNFTFRHKILNFVIYFFILLIGIYSLFLIKKEKMPLITQTEINIVIDWNENIDATENKVRVLQILKKIKKEINQSNSYVGQQQFILNHINELETSDSRIYVKCPNTECVKNVKNLVRSFLLEYYSKANLSFEPPTSIFERLFSNNEPPLEARISMKNERSQPDLPLLLKVCNELNRDSSLNATNKLSIQENINIKINLEKMMLYKISYEELINELKIGLNEKNIGLLKSAQRYLPIYLKGNNLALSDIVNKKDILNEDNIKIPLSSLISISKGEELKTIVSGKEGEYFPLDFAPELHQKNQYISRISGVVRNHGLFNVSFSGSLFSNLKLLQEIGILLLISILILYFILAAQFESLIQPLIVLIEIPIDIGASLFVLLILGQTLNLMSAMGMVVMSGIIITDSILKLDVINKLRREGIPLMDAIMTGGHRRLRAIIMTGLTSILAMLPLLFTNDLGSELQKSFSYTLIAGMVIGTFVSLFLVPLIYWYVYKN